MPGRPGPAAVVEDQGDEGRADGEERAELRFVLQSRAPGVLFRSDAMDVFRRHRHEIDSPDVAGFVRRHDPLLAGERAD